MGGLLRSSVRSDRATPQGCIMEHSTGLGDTTPTGYLMGLVRIWLGEASGIVSLGCDRILLSASLSLRFAFCCWDKNTDRKHLWEGKGFTWLPGYSSSEKLRQEPKQRP